MKSRTLTRLLVSSASVCSAESAPGDRDVAASGWGGITMDDNGGAGGTGRLTIELTATISG